MQLAEDSSGGSRLDSGAEKKRKLYGAAQPLRRHRLRLSCGRRLSVGDGRESRRPAFAQRVVFFFETQIGLSLLLPSTLLLRLPTAWRRITLRLRLRAKDYALIILHSSSPPLAPAPRRSKIAEAFSVGTDVNRPLRTRLSSGEPEDLLQYRPFI